MANISSIKLPSGITYDLIDSTVPSWAKQLSKPTYTASEVGALSATAARVISIGSSTTAQSLSIRYKTEGSSGSTSTTVSILGVSDITAGNTAGTIEVTKCTGDSAFSTGTITIPGIPTTASDIGAIPTTEKGAANGVAPLDTNGLIASAYLPSYVDDVLEYATRAGFPAMGETGKIYVDTDTNKTYRWGGSEYVEISASLALGKTSSTAAPGNHTHSVSITPSTTSVYSITSLGTANTPTQIDTSKFSGGSLTMEINGTDSSQLDITFTAAAPQSGFYTVGTAATMPTRSQVTGLWNGYTSATAQAIQ